MRSGRRESMRQSNNERGPGYRKTRRHIRLRKQIVAAILLLAGLATIATAVRTNGRKSQQGASVRMKSRDLHGPKPKTGYGCACAAERTATSAKRPVEIRRFARRCCERL